MPAWNDSLKALSQCTWVFDQNFDLGRPDVHCAVEGQEGMNNIEKDKKKAL